MTDWLPSVKIRNFKKKTHAQKTEISKENKKPQDIITINKILFLRNLPKIKLINFFKFKKKNKNPKIHTLQNSLNWPKLFYIYRFWNEKKNLYGLIFLLIFFSFFVGKRRDHFYFGFG